MDKKYAALAAVLLAFQPGNCSDYSLLEPETRVSKPGFFKRCMICCTKLCGTGPADPGPQGSGYTDWTPSLDGVMYEPPPIPVMPAPHGGISVVDPYDEFKRENISSPATTPPGTSQIAPEHQAVSGPDSTGPAPIPAAPPEAQPVFRQSPIRPIGEYSPRGNGAFRPIGTPAPAPAIDPVRATILPREGSILGWDDARLAGAKTSTRKRNAADINDIALRAAASSWLLEVEEKRRTRVVQQSEDK